MPERRLSILLAIRDTLLRLIPSELLKKGTWIHWRQCEALQTKLSTNYAAVTQVERARLLREAQVFLAPLSIDPACRRRRWTNVNFCPVAPYGNYWWLFHMEMVQELLWLYPEFVAGFRFGRKLEEPYRDGNPYKEVGRNRSWDCGYILGLTKASKLRTWLAERAESNQKGA